ncbi:AlkA N-terminal domain-containing protein [Nonomuraea sp. NPDC059194]|uniref:AlkA N-terminal domain-containing protein n=1 Tax=Nonomuraea sp. NPDC059194 TaxID=3346764 RepID=UPI0036C2800E
MIAEDSVYAAMESRDSRFDGWVFVAVTTTRIYCRPSCPAVMPKREHLQLYPTAAAAQVNGFRACKRCRPDAAPGSPEWNLRADVVGRAMRLIADGVIDREGVAGLAYRLGYSQRQVYRQLVAEVGAGPQALARAQRAQTARVLLESTLLPVSDIVFAAGFGSVRQFNDTIRQLYGTTPSELRARAGPTTSGAIALRLPYRPPMDVAFMLAALGAEAVPGIAEYENGIYRRSLVLPYGTGVVTLAERPGSTYVACELRLDDLRDLPAAVGRCRRLLDLDADQEAIDRCLGPLAEAAPGRRVPGTVDPAELLTRELLGPERLAEVVERHGKPLATPVGGVTRGFPRLDALKEAGLRGVELGTEADPDQFRALPGLTERAAAVIRMRALRDPDVVLPDVSLPDADCWRPWRSYAMQHLTGSGPG